MFGIHMITDIIKIPASDLVYQPCSTHKKTDSTWLSMLPILHREIDKIYPNRVLINVGLLISRYYHHHHAQQLKGAETTVLSIDGNNYNVPLNEESYPPPMKKRRIMDPVPHKRVPKFQEYSQTTQFMQTGGVCDGSSVHYTVTFPMIVFRPYISEILVGTILDANASGMIVSLGFLATIFVPAYYMLQPSTFVVSSASSQTGVWVWAPTYDEEHEDDYVNTDTQNEPLRYEMNIGAEIRVRVKSIHFTPVTSTAKGTPVIMSNTTADSAKGSVNQNPLNHKESMIQAKHQRSSSFSAYNDSIKPSSVSSNQQPNTSMYIIASICEDGLGLTSWWTHVDENEEDHETQPE